MSKQTAVDFLLEIYFERSENLFLEDFQKALKMERDQMTDLVESLKDYTKESHTVLGYDVRESSELVGMHLTQTIKPQTK